MKLNMFDPKTNELILTSNSATFRLRNEDDEYTPVFCLTCIFRKDMEIQCYLYLLEIFQISLWKRGLKEM